MGLRLRLREVHWRLDPVTRVSWQSPQIQHTHVSRQRWFLGRVREKQANSCAKFKKVTFGNRTHAGPFDPLLQLIKRLPPSQLPWPLFQSYKAAESNVTATSLKGTHCVRNATHAIRYQHLGGCLQHTCALIRLGLSILPPGVQMILAIVLLCAKIVGPLRRNRGNSSSYKRLEPIPFRGTWQRLPSRLFNRICLKHDQPITSPQNDSSPQAKYVPSNHSPGAMVKKQEPALVQWGYGAP